MSDGGNYQFQGTARVNSNNYEAHYVKTTNGFAKGVCLFRGKKANSTYHGTWVGAMVMNSTLLHYCQTHGDVIVCVPKGSTNPSLTKIKKQLH